MSKDERIKELEKDLQTAKDLVHHAEAKHAKLQLRNAELFADVTYVYCPGCKKPVFESEVTERFHTCHSQTVPLFSEERRKRFRAEEQVEKLTAGNAGLVREKQIYADDNAELRVCYVEMGDKIKTLEGENAKLKAECEWEYDSGHDLYFTGCGECYCFETGKRKDNHHMHCPHCGLLIKEKDEANNGKG